MFCALLTSRYQVSVYRTNGPLVNQESEPLYSYSVITVESSSAVSWMHHIMPVSYACCTQTPSPTPTLPVYSYSVITVESFSAVSWIHHRMHVSYACCTHTPSPTPTPPVYSYSVITTVESSSAVSWIHHTLL